jgi:hypothetical protein
MFEFFHLSVLTGEEALLKLYGISIIVQQTIFDTNVKCVLLFPSNITAKNL